MSKSYLNNKKNILNSIIFIVIGALMMSFNYYNTNILKPKIKISAQESKFIIKKDILKYYHLGQKRLLTDLLWIETLLDGDLEHYKKMDLGSWMYMRFDQITELDPLFREAYRFGGIYLSVIKDDKVGAIEIIEKGLKVYPNDNKLLYNGGMHYLFELNDNKNAIKLFKKLSKHPKKPKLLDSLLGRLIAEEYDLNDAYKLIYNSYLAYKDDENMRKKYEYNLYSIKAEIDLNCLNSKKKKCNYYDFYGEKYKFDGLKYSANRKWKKFRINKRKKTSN